MITIKVITGYTRYTEDALRNTAQKACDSLNGNVNFDFTAEDISRFQTEISSFDDLRIKAQSGTSADVSRKNEAKKVLIQDMHYLSVEVNQQSHSDLVKLQSSGFPLAKSRGSVGTLPKPTAFQVKSGLNSGDLLFEVDANPNCQVYLFFYAPMPAPDEVSDMRKIVSTTHKRNTGSFIPGTQYKCLCAYQGAETELVYSDPVYIFAQ